MKKLNRTKICYGISILLALVFIVKTAADYARYSSTLNSAPFYVWILVNVVYFILPALIAFVAGVILKKKTKH